MKNILRITAFLDRFTAIQKIIAIIVVNLAILVTLAAYAILVMQKIGDELIAIAERDVPLMEIVMGATTHQLEQAILFEKAVRQGEAAALDPKYLADAMKTEKEFVKFSHKVEAEIAEGRDKAKVFYGQARKPEEKKLFKHVEEELASLYLLHKDYHTHAESLFEEMNAGQMDLVHKHIDGVEKEQHHIDKSLETVLFEIEHFIADQTKKLEHEEIAAQKFLMLFGAIAILFSSLFSTIIALNMAAQEKLGNIMKECLTNLDNNVIIADNKDDISYMNTSSHHNLKKLETGIREAYPHFDAENLIGQSIHRMHKDPDRIRKLLAALQPGQIHKGEINLGDRILSLNVGPIYANGVRLGNYAEWRDITEDRQAELLKKELEEQLGATAESVNAAAKEIAEGNLNLSERTEAQAANIEETTASMQQITERVQESSQNTENALGVVSATQSAADSGGDVVASAIGAMEQISESAERINDIIGVIDEIAFQTNLLALNAAVEAARAGDAGRGFAVVASEVRALAGRSADAAREIKDLITESVDRVKTGTEQVNKTGECLEDIIGNVRSVTSTMQEIASSSQEQSTSIAEVNKAIAQMDSFTQQNAALVEQAAAASKSLQEQAGALAQLVTRMKEE